MKELRLSDILARTVEEGDCLIWTGYVENNRPRWRFAGKSEAPRRTVYEAVHGKLPKRMQVGVRCGNDLCVHPDCGIARSRSAAMKSARFKANHAANVAKARREQSALSDAAIQAIRQSNEPVPALARAHGISASYARRIRNGVCRKEYGSPFAGLGAR